MKRGKEATVIKALYIILASTVPALLFALAGGCDSSSSSRPNQDNGTGIKTYALELDLDIECHGTLILELNGADIAATLTMTDPTDHLAADIPMQGTGRLYEFPESGSRLYTALIQGPSVPGGPCGDDIISLALSLSSKHENTYLVGALTAYCGEETYVGRPSRVVRIAGEMKLCN